MECTIPNGLKASEPTQEEEDMSVEQGSSGEPDDPWVVHVDGSSNSIGSRASLLILIQKIYYGIHLEVRYPSH